MTELKLENIFLECDQAIYTKVLQVLFKFNQEGSNHFDKIVVRMGGFHIVMCLMKAIYSIPYSLNLVFGQKAPSNLE